MLSKDAADVLVTLQVQYNTIVCMPEYLCERATCLDDLVFDLLGWAVGEVLRRPYETTEQLFADRDVFIDSVLDLSFAFSCENDPWQQDLLHEARFMVGDRMQLLSDTLLFAWNEWHKKFELLECD